MPCQASSRSPTTHHPQGSELTPQSSHRDIPTCASQEPTPSPKTLQKAGTQRSSLPPLLLTLPLPAKPNATLHPTKGAPHRKPPWGRTQGGGAALRGEGWR